jgi:hypothetical protein
MLEEDDLYADNIANAILMDIFSKDIPLDILNGNLKTITVSKEEGITIVKIKEGEEN